MPKYYVHKNGKVANVFSTPFTEWSSPPEVFPLQTLNGINTVEQLYQELGTSDLVVIDRPAPAEQPQAAKLPIAALMATLAGMTNLPQDEKDKIIAKNSGEDFQSPIAQLRAETDIEDRILQEFRLVVAENKMRNPAEIEAVGSFILAICPHLDAQLKLIIQPTERRRFTL